MNNIEKIKQALLPLEYNAILITDPFSRQYATGFESESGALLVTESDAWFFTDSRFIEAAEAAVAGAAVLPVTDEKTYSEQIKAILKDNRLFSLGFEDSSVSYAGHLDWEEKLEVKLIPAQKLLIDLRAVKSADELEKMIKAERIAEKSFNEILPVISTEMTEKELAAELVYRFLKNGADDKSFNPIVVSGPKSSMPHGVPGDEKIGKGFLTIDFGVRLDGWCSDTTRTLCIGKPDEEMVKIYNTVLSAQEAGIGAARAGAAAKDVDAAARAVIEDAGYGQFFGHGFGHGVGLEIHEAPRVAKTSEDTLHAGAVISAEPGIYIPGKYGVRIEDVLFITENGCDNITDLPKELIVL
jgi:Xaa-Pro aminopeptidase